MSDTKIETVTEAATDIDSPNSEKELMSAEDFITYFESRIVENDRQYFKIHKLRFLETLRSLPVSNMKGQRAIEVGTYGFFCKALKAVGGYDTVDGSIFEASNPYKIQNRRFYFDDDQEDYRLFNLDIEKECFPLSEPAYDLVLAPEILEHMAIDPMGFFWELNRITKENGRLIVTTPNVASAENIFRILWRQVPNPYYYYRSGRHSDRHNLEYGPDLLKQSMECAGFAVERIWTKNCWTQERPEIIEMIKANGFPTELREDNLFIQGVKVSEPHERFPKFLYD